MQFKFSFLMQPVPLADSFFQLRQLTVARAIGTRMPLSPATSWFQTQQLATVETSGAKMSGPHVASFTPVKAAHSSWRPWHRDASSKFPSTSITATCSFFIQLQPPLTTDSGGHQLHFGHCLSSYASYSTLSVVRSPRYPLVLLEKCAVKPSTTLESP